MIPNPSKLAKRLVPAAILAVAAIFSPEDAAACDWKAWPGGQTDQKLNPTELFTSADFGFSGNVDWDVSKGGVPGVIIETGTTTATNLSSIHVRYDAKSPSAFPIHAAWIQAKKAGKTGATWRTVFKVQSISRNCSGDLDKDNDLPFGTGTGFPVEYGSNRRKCGFNWPPENDARVISAKMEAVFSFSPTGIDWPARGVTFVYPPAGKKFDCRIDRRSITTIVAQLKQGASRIVAEDQAEWMYDGTVNEADAQYPTAAKPDKAFRIDAPWSDQAACRQSALRSDFREVVRWCNGPKWSDITPLEAGEWHANETAVLPDAAKGGDNSHGSGITATDIPNSRPEANAGNDQTVHSAQPGVTLHGDGSDADNDTWTYKWTQTQGTMVELSDDTAREPRFNAPAGPDTLVFSLRVSDITKDLHHHNPNTFESDPDTVTVTVNAP